MAFAAISIHLLQVCLFCMGLGCFQEVKRAPKYGRIKMAEVCRRFLYVWEVLRNIYYIQPSITSHELTKPMTDLGQVYDIHAVIFSLSESDRCWFITSVRFLSRLNIVTDLLDHSRSSLLKPVVLQGII